MPAAYAHYRFGRELLGQLPAALGSIVDSCRSFYDLGLHGPDLLFYYRPLHKNPVSALGSAIHRDCALDFFRPAGEQLHRSQSPELTAYIYGCICHFSLDLFCHGYIQRVTNQGGSGHNEQEAALDLLLLKEDGLEPRPGIRVRHIKPSLGAGQVIAPLYPGIGPGKLCSAMLSMKMLDGFLGLRGPGLSLVRGVLNLSGSGRQLEGMLLNLPGNNELESLARELMELYCQAQDTALRLISEFRDSAWGRSDYDPLYRYSFDARLVGPEKERK